MNGTNRIVIDTPGLEDTKNLDFGTYVYDLQITFADGTVDTFISKSILKLEEEVD